jgi:hypothetical protein
MLDEEEFARVAQLYGNGFRSAPQQEEEAGPPTQPLTIEERFAPVSREYARLTGYVGCHPNAVMHHRLSLFGPPCSACNKPLRTPGAKLCAECGAPRPAHSLE